MADKKGVTEAINARERRVNACRHEEYVNPPAFPGAPLVKACRLCNREIQIKENR